MIKGTTKRASGMAFVVLALGCGGRAEIQGSASVGGGEAAGGTPSTAVAGSSAAGSPSVEIGNVAGSSMGGSTPVGTGDAGASNGEVGGAMAVAGPAAGAYCAVTLAPPAQTMAFATTEVVWNRIQSFLGTAQQIAVDLPAESSRVLAGDLADKTLDSLNGAPAPGLASFVNAWWPGTPNADAWAGLFGDSKATLTDLLTTTSVANPGSGVLTDPAVLKLTEISTRGIFIDEHLVCMPVPPSPLGLPSLGPAQPGQTRRQQLEQSLVIPSCVPCHQEMDPIGDSLEHYDTVGMFNTLDNGSPIDSSGTWSDGITGEATITFANVNELGEGLAKECGVSVCLTQQLLADAETSAKLPVPGSADPQAVASIAFASRSGNLRDLIRNIVESDTFLRAK
jgi:hypothetical protein